MSDLDIRTGKPLITPSKRRLAALAETLRAIGDELSALNTRVDDLASEIDCFDPDETENG